MTWTTPKDLTRQVHRLWERGWILQSLLTHEAVFPKRLVLKTPSAQALAHSFGEVRDWCASLSEVKHLRFETKDVRNRVTGTNTYPAEAWIDSADDAVALLGKKKELQQFTALVELTRTRRPALLPWLRKRPLVALVNADNWARFLDLVDWALTHPKPNCYLRQVDLPGIHTKFIEAHRGLLAELFDLVVDPVQINHNYTGVHGFCPRYGFRDKPERIRLRVLDPSCNPLHMVGCPDITLTIDTLRSVPSGLKELPETIFVTENETNFLAFPRVPKSWLLFGAGYGFSTLKDAPWLVDCRILYWGDIDTHGFAILDGIRSTFPHAESLLMDRPTLLAHRHFWDTEPTPTQRNLPRLNAVESALYRDLQQNTLAPNLRLEQERIPYSHLFQALRELNYSPEVQ